MIQLIQRQCKFQLQTVDKGINNRFLIESLFDHRIYIRQGPDSSAANQVCAIGRYSSSGTHIKIKLYPWHKTF